MNAHTPLFAPAVDVENPWPGLASFTEESRAFFHGRDQEIAELSRRVQRKLLTVLFGQSGLGKTSILRAGVVPRLRDEGYVPVYVRIDYSAGAPLPTQQVKQAVLAATAAAGTWSKPSAEENAETLWEFLHHRGDALRDARDRTLTPLIIFDQFEEVFTLAQSDDAGRQRAADFLDDLADLVENRAPRALEARLESDDSIVERFDFARADYRVLISLREDYLPHLESLKSRMPSVTQNRVRLAPMTGAQALDAVVKPGGALVTPEVARAIVEFVAGAKGGSIERLAELQVEPPLLSVICRELNERRRALGQAQITADLVTGNRREILTDFYERCVADLPEAMRRFVEDKLLTKSGFRDNLALETALEEPGVTRELIDTLVSRRLLRIEDRIGTQRVELTHDVLADVVRASRDARQQRILLQQAQERERQAVAAADRRTRRMRIALAGLVAVVVALSIGAVFGLRAQRRSVTQASQSDFLLGSRALDEGKVAEGLAYLVRAGRKDPANPIVAPRILTELAARNFFLPANSPLTLPSSTLRARFTADGKRVLVHGADKVLRVIDVQSWTLERELQFTAPVVPGGWVPASQNPDIVAVQLENGTFLACDLRTGKPTRPPIARLEGSSSRAVALSPDGRWLADRVADGIGVWSTAGELHTTIPAGSNSGYTFSADGHQIATYAQGTQSWSVPDGAAIGAPMPTSTGGVYGRYYTVGGKRMVLVYSRTVEVYDISSGEPAGPALTFDFTIRSAGISPDNTRLFVGGDRQFGVVDLVSGRVVTPMIDVGGRAADASSSKDGRVVLTCSTNGFFNVWDSTTGKLLAEPSFKQRGFAPAALSPDGATVVAFTAGHAHLLRLTQGAAQPLVLPRAPSVALVNLVRGSPTRVAWVTPTHFNAIDAATGRETSDGFAWPSRILGPAGSIRSTHGSLFGAGDNLVVITKQTGALKTWRGWTLGQHGIERDVELQDVPADVTRFRPTPTGGIAAATGLAASRMVVGIWDLESGRHVANFQAPEQVNEILTTISPDRKLVAFRTVSGAIRIGDIANGQVLCALQLTDGLAALQVFRFTPDSRQLLTGDDWGGVQVWDARSGKIVKSAQPHRAAVRRIDLSADQRFYVSLALDGSMQAWDSATHQPYGELLIGASFSAGGRADFSSDNQRLITSALGDTVRVWDIGSGLPLTPGLSQSGDSPNVLAYGPDGRFVEVHGTGAGTTRIRMWAAPPDGHGTKTPSWLLDLATIAGGQRLTEEGKFESIAEELGKMAAVRSALDALPPDDPYGTWASWFLARTTSRPIAPGFKITPAEAAKQAERMDAEAQEERNEQSKVAGEIASLTPRANQLRFRRAWSEVEPLDRRLTELIRIRDGDGTVTYEGALANLALAVFRTGKAAEAEPMAREVLTLRETRGAAAQPVANARGLLGLILSELNRNAEAEPLLASNYDAIDNAGVKTDVARALAKIYADSNRPTDAAEWQRKAAGTRAAPLPPKQRPATKGAPASSR